MIVFFKRRHSKISCFPVRRRLSRSIPTFCVCRSNLLTAITLNSGPRRAFARQLRFDANYFRRYVNNYADDDQILSTAVSFPIAFRKAILYGAEAKIEVPHWKRFSGFLSYSYIVGNAWFPVTGGLFLGDDAVSALTQFTGHFPDSQDQRNTARIRIRYQVASRFWLATGAEYGSGLPFEFDGDPSDALADVRTGRSRSHRFRSRPHQAHAVRRCVRRRGYLQEGKTSTPASG